MKRIIAYNVRDEEVQLAFDWAKAHDVELVIAEGQLSVDTVHLAEGFDGVTTSQNSKVVKEVYETLKNYGIKQIAQRSAGFDYYDLEAATANDIIITNVPSYSPESIAEYSLTAALNMVRKWDDIQVVTNNHDFRWQVPIRAGLVNEMTVGIIGTGHIGLTTAKLFKALGAKIVAYDLYRNDKAEGILEYRDSIEDVVKESDIVSLHVPATKDNFHQFNYELFKNFKPTAYLVNAARGSIVDTEGLMKALDDNLLAGATLDTYENESDYIPKDWSQKDLEDKTLEKMLNHPKITFTPHIAFYTDVSVRNIMTFALQATLDVIETGDTTFRVN